MTLPGHIAALLYLAAFGLGWFLSVWHARPHVLALLEAGNLAQENVIAMTEALREGSRISQVITAKTEQLLHDNRRLWWSAWSSAWAAIGNRVACKNAHLTLARKLVQDDLTKPDSPPFS